MARPKLRRCVRQLPRYERYMPADESEADIVVLSLDEAEALRLADLERLYHAEAAEKMGVSRQTFGRIVSSARFKTAQALIHGRGMVIEEGEAVMSMKRKFECTSCERSWEEPHGTGRPDECPGCGGKNLHRAFRNQDRRHHHGWGCHHGHHGGHGRGHGRGRNC